MRPSYSIASLLLFTVAASMGGSAASTTNEESRRTNAEIQRIVGYLPNNDVSDQFDLDKDLTEMENLVLQNQLPHAKKVYMEGGYSMSYANITVINASAHGTFRAGEEVVGHNNAKVTVFGKVMDTVSFKKGDNVNVKILYTKNEPSPTCAVGALHTFRAAVKTNCK
jgi:membrane-associated protease RseP (regulator of RpoE activity)